MGFEFGFEVEDTSRTSSEDITLAKPQRVIPVIRTPTHSYDFGNVDEAALPPRRRQSVAQYPTGAKLAFLFTSLVSACFLMLLNTSVVSTAIPKITDEFQSLKDIGWYASSYTLASAVLQPVTGKIYHHFPLKWSFLTLFFFFEVGNAICGSAQTSMMLILGLAVSGMGASGLVNGSFTIIAASAPPERQPFLVGTLMAIAHLGVVLGPLVGGAFTTAATWRWSFYVNLPIGALVAIPLAIIQIPEQMPKRPAMQTVRSLHKHFDLVGFALYGPSVIQLMLALGYGGKEHPWTSPTVIGLFCGSGATFVLWCIWSHYKGDEALLPFSVIRRQVIWMSALNYSFLMSCMLGTAYWLPVYFQAVKGVSAIMSGVYYLPSVLPQVLAGAVSGKLVTKVGYVPPFSITAGVLASVGCGLLALLQPGTGPAMWVSFQIIAGIGRGLGMQMPILAAQNAIKPTEIAPTMAFLVTLQFLGPAIFLSLYNIVFNQTLRAEMVAHAPDVDISVVLKLGATRFRQLLTAEELPGVLKAYSDSLDTVFLFVTGVALVIVVTGFGMGWKNIRPAEEVRTRNRDSLTAEEQVARNLKRMSWQ